MKIRWYNSEVGLREIKFKTPLTIDRYELEELVQIYSNRKVDILKTFWAEDYSNDSYKTLWYKDLYYDTLKCIKEHLGGRTEATSMDKDILAVCGFLEHIIPEDYEYDYILVDITW